MAESKLVAIVEVMLKYHQQGIDVESTAANLLKNGYYVYPKVCVASVNYWFHFFNEHPYRFSCEYPHICVTPQERLVFLSVLIKINRKWQWKHFADALKVDITTVQSDMNGLGYFWSSHGWTQRIITSQ
ncbi:hypothetical protein M0804_011681 [Polistes exclamans]|nr:hypothetical protein M0804_011681 [Polistes exclamans]